MVKFGEPTAAIINLEDFRLLQSIKERQAAGALRETLAGIRQRGEKMAPLAALLSQAEVVVTQLDLSGVTRDPKDDPLVAVAVAGGVDYLVSGDQDLLELAAYEGVKAIAPKDLVEILDLD